MGSPVAFPTPTLLQEIAGHNIAGAALGHFALGEYIYADGADHLRSEDWMQIKSPEVLVKFPIENLVSRRSFVFARAGFGKSNLNKLLFSTLYKTGPWRTTADRLGGGLRREPEPPWASSTPGLGWEAVPALLYAPGS